MTERADELKFLLAAETGQPPSIVDMMQYGAAVSGLQYYATAADKFTWRDIRDGVYGVTVALKGNEITHNKLSDIAGVPKLVPPDNTMITTARNIGISFGD